MDNVTLIGVDLAKRVFHLHGAAADGSVMFRKKLSRTQFGQFIESLPRCIVAMEACGSAHYWGRLIAGFGHEVRLVPPVYAKQYVKRHKNDAADAEAIAEAASRPTMRFVTVKSQTQQTQAMAYRSRDMLVRQRTQLINALRGHLTEFGVVAPQGIAQIKKLAAAIDVPETELPGLARQLAHDHLDMIEDLTARIAVLDRTLQRVTAADEKTAYMRTVPGVGPITAAAIEAFAPSLESFRRGRDFAAWLGLVPKQHSTGGKERLGRVSKMGQRDIRRLLIGGAMAVIRWEIRKGDDANPWIARLLARKPRLVAAVALANKMARMIWATVTKKQDYQIPVAT
ncbi:IS110 family RNA-guided transposase [Sedimentitalea todarodis]|uniref:IS110 family transposase n=1 Tax=Sedimentitalea todarodis TaxID=1631240 RepID=A0ABU3VGV9_9RHOB|nr:IS110 family transposase [Sedimentitalea todarodis]MDU9005419.1 IS110 family transposase [Sedimentitalea todarodis]